MNSLDITLSDEYAEEQKQPQLWPQTFVRNTVVSLQAYLSQLVAWDARCYLFCRYPSEHFCKSKDKTFSFLVTTLSHTEKPLTPGAVWSLYVILVTV